MNEISINKAVVTDHISNIKNSLESLTNQHIVTHANRTTVGGNNKPHETINNEKTVVNSFIVALQDAQAAYSVIHFPLSGMIAELRFLRSKLNEKLNSCRDV